MPVALSKQTLSIQMVDLKSQYLRLKSEIDLAILNCIDASIFIKGPILQDFEASLAKYLEVKNVVSCANGTDALQLALMGLNLNKGDEVIVPAFTYVATAEVIALLGLVPVMVDVDPSSFNITAENIAEAIGHKTKAVVPVHLFGQTADMEPILNLCRENNLKVVEDTAQSIGAHYTFSDGSCKAAGALGDIGTTSFFPAKNFGCFGDGGALYTNNDLMAKNIRMMANHGQQVKYRHDIIGVNSRLDTLQAAILRVKLKHLKSFEADRLKAANYYDQAFKGLEAIETPFRLPSSTHVFHQYTLKVPADGRSDLQKFLRSEGIPSMVYYPIPLNQQPAYKSIGRVVGDLKNTKSLCSSVISLPMHTELDEIQQNYIADNLIRFFKH
jgi:UDP-2-acetamido-2-deoxy-ribo-hexuluronate aminotransferase